MAERNRMTIQAEVPSSDRTAEEIRQDIAEKRGYITETVDRLNDRVQETLDWRSYVADHPFAAIAVAAGIGYLVSGIFKPRPTPRDRIMDAVAESVEDLTDRLRSAIDMLPARKLVTGRTVKAAITAVATKAAVDLAKRELNGVLNRRADSDEERSEIRKESDQRNSRSGLNAAEASQARR